MSLTDTSDGHAMFTFLQVCAYYKAARTKDLEREFGDMCMRDQGQAYSLMMHEIVMDHAA